MVTSSELATCQVINWGEYFFDHDPGKGNGTDLAITPGPVVDANVSIPISSVANGFHTLNIRLKDSNGKWSHFASRSFFIIPPATTIPASSAFVAMEYFFNHDPGPGNAIAIAVSPGASINQNVVIPVGGLQPGFHQLGIRGQDNNHRWSHFAVRTFYIVAPPVILPDATTMRAEYFIDNDPGAGHGFDLPVSASANQDNSFVIDITSVQPGFHRLGIRYLSNNGKWSHFAIRTFYILPPGLSQPDRIVEVQYFVDVNPETGSSATPVIVSVPPTDILDASLVFEMNGVAPGDHEIFVRVKNNKGYISPVHTGQFTVLDCTAPVPPTASPVSACGSGIVQLHASGALGNQQYVWYENETASIPLHEGESYTTPELFTSRNYFVALRDPVTTCQSTRASVNVTIISEVPALNISGEMVLCEGNSVTITAPANYPSYRWSNGATTRNINVSLAGSYSVIVGNGECESAPSLPAVVVLSQRPQKPVLQVTGDLLCAGASVTIAGPDNAAAYLWSSGLSSPTISPTSPGAYTLVVFNADGCESQPSEPAMIHALPVVPQVFVVGNTTFCAGSAATMVAPSGYSYSWSNGKTTQAITESASGNYSLRVTDVFGCTSAPSVPVELTVHAKPATPTIEVAGETSFCPGESVQLSGPAGFGYVWSTGATTQTIIATGTGSYSLLVSDQNNCVSDVTPAVITTLLPCSPINARPPFIQEKIITVPVNESVTIDFTNSITDPDDDLDLSTLKIISLPPSGALASVSGPVLLIDYSVVEFAGHETITLEVCDKLNNCTRKDTEIHVVGNVIVFNAISPNGDGLNESLFFEYISLLEESRENRVRIFNRWGEAVYDALGYNNTTIAFKGIGTNGDILPPGTYFFRIDFTSGIPVKTGYFSLRR
jgi:gliding motility-associated-like protein